MARFTYVKQGQTYELQHSDAFVSISLFWADLSAVPQEYWGNYDIIVDPVSGQQWPLHRQYIHELRPGRQIVKNSFAPLIVVSGTEPQYTTYMFYIDTDAPLLDVGQMYRYYVEKIGMKVLSVSYRFDRYPKETAKITLKDSNSSMYYELLGTQGNTNIKRHLGIGTHTVSPVSIVDFVRIQNLGTQAWTSLLLRVLVQAIGPVVRVKDKIMREV